MSLRDPKIDGAAGTSAQALERESGQQPNTSNGAASPTDFLVAAPSLSLPKGGGAIRGIGETFAVSPATGTLSLKVPIFVSPGRDGFGPKLSLSYDFGNGNGPFGLGWDLSLPMITRRTDRGLPLYQDAETQEDHEFDTFLHAGSSELVRALIPQGSAWISSMRTALRNGRRYRVFAYRPRIEAAFMRIERWLCEGDPADHAWRAITPDNVTCWYGLTAESRIADPSDPSRIFGWLAAESYDDKGNAMLFCTRRKIRQASTALRCPRSTG